MEKINSKIVEMPQIIHEFYCDDCGEYIGSSDEYDDGYYYEPSVYELKYFLNGSWYKLKKCLCEDCVKKKNNTIKQMFLDNGFVIETDW